MAITRYQFDPKSSAGSDLFYFDWQPFVAANANDSIDPVSVQVTANGSGLVISDIALIGFIVKCRIAAGTPNVTYTISCRMRTLSLGRDETLEGTLYIYRATPVTDVGTIAGMPLRLALAGAGRALSSMVTLPRPILAGLGHA